MSLPTLDTPPYTLANLLYGVIQTGSNSDPRCAVAIGEHAQDLKEYAKTGKLSSFESGHSFKLESTFVEVSRLQSSNARYCESTCL